MRIMGKGEGGCVAMWIFILFHNTIIKSANVDKGEEEGDKTLIHQMWIKSWFLLILPVGWGEITL